jgi:hypothetical protein
MTTDAPVNGMIFRTRRLQRGRFYEDTSRRSIDRRTIAVGNGWKRELSTALYGNYANAAMVGYERGDLFPCKVSSIPRTSTRRECRNIAVARGMREIKTACLLLSNHSRGPERSESPFF